MRERAQAHGPYQHGKRWRVHFVTGSGGARTTHYEAFDTKAAADACVAGARDEAQGITVSAAVAKYVAHVASKGRADRTLEAYRDRLGTLLAPVSGRALRAVVGRGEELYLATIQGRRADTHRNYLTAGRIWGRWCVKQGWLRANPFTDVEPLGQRTAGGDKVRLGVDESRRLDAWCRARPADPGAILTLAYLLLGARASELVKRDVRDLDDDGRLLWIGHTKTRAGRRKLRIPDELATMLVAHVAGKPADAPIFLNAYGRRMSRYVARLRVLEVTTAAKVTAVPPQALRRTQSTLATEAGETALAVARHLGHATGAAPAVTERSYVGREAAADAKAERALKLIQGGKGR
jgi:integrase